MKRRTLLKFFQTSIFTCILLLFFFLVSVGVVYVIIQFLENNEGSLEKPTFSYQILEYDAVNSETTLGMIDLFHPLDEEFDFRKKSNGNYALISQFGSEEFECKGVCFCGKGEERRSYASSVIQKPIFYLVATLTSVLAYELAKVYFDDECRIEMSEDGDCSDQSSIESEVLECKKSIPEGDVNEDLEERYYQCKGFCRPIESYKEYVRLQHQFLKMREQPDKCELAHKSTGQGVLLKIPPTTPENKGNEMAAKYFHDNELDNFCRTFMTITKSLSMLENAIRLYDEEGVRTLEKQQIDFLKSVREYNVGYFEWYKKSGNDDQEDKPPEKFSICRGNDKRVECRKVKRR